MKTKYLFPTHRLYAAVCTLLTLFTLGIGNAWGAEEVYKTALFGSSYNSKGVSGYTGVSFDATNDGFTVNVANANNNNNGWGYIKIGGRNAAYTGTIITDAAIDKKITKVTIYISAITAGNVTSITLYKSTNKSTWTSIGTFDKSVGDKVVSIAADTQAANLYYKVEVVCTKGSSNGLVTINNVKYYYDNSGGGTNYTVTWKSNGVTHTTTSVTSGNRPTFPSNPSSCDGTSTTFVGWTTAEWTGKLDDVSAKTIYKTADAMPTVSGDVTYYAVFAKATANTYKKGSLSDLTNGQTVLIVNPTNSVAMKGDKSALSVSISSNAITTTNTNVLWTVETASGGFCFKYNGNYLNSTSSGLAVNGTTDIWVVSESGPYYLTSSNYSTRKLEYYNSNFTTYTGTGNAYKMDFYIPALEGYLTNCCTPYTITLANGGTAANGTFSCKTSACEDEIVELIATPATGYQLAEWSVYKTGTPATTVTVTNNQFVMPAYGITVNATFETKVYNLILSANASGSCEVKTNGTAQIKHNGTALEAGAVHATREGYELLGYTDAPSGGTMKNFIGADGSLPYANVTGWVTDGHWSNTTDNLTVYARWECGDTVRITTVASGSGTVTHNRANGIETCNCNAASRQVIITATPSSSDYTATGISYSGAGTPTKVSGPTIDGSSTKWVYQFENNINGNGTFTVTFAEKEHFTVTWDAAGTISTSSVLVGEKPAAFPSTPISCDATSTTFVGWSTTTWDGKIANLDGKTVYTSVEDMPAVLGPVTYYAVWCQGGTGESWVLTPLASLTTTDVFVLSNGSYAASNDNGTSSAPACIAITVSGDHITSAVADNIKWNISGNASSGYTFYPNGSTDKLYCMTAATKSTNDNIRVGAGGDYDRYVWKPDANGYLVSEYTFTEDNDADRYLSLNGTSDWRSYLNTNTNPVIPQCYKYTTGGGGSNYLTTCCTEVSRPNVTVELHSTYVTLTWPNDANAVSYSVTCSGGTVGSITGTNTKSCSITGLTGETSYTYSVTAAGSTCSQSANGSFTTANCDDVPFVESAVASGTFVTFNWRNTNNNTIIKLYSDEGCTTEVRSKATTHTTTSKSDTIAGLAQETTYYYILWSNGTCPSISGSFTTLENRITIAEWDTAAVYLDLGDMTSATAIVANQNTQAEVKQNYAEDIFFSKYFEASGYTKLVGLYNGTDHDIDISDLIIKGGKTEWSTTGETNYIDVSKVSKLKTDYGVGESIMLPKNTEIIFYTVNASNKSGYSGDGCLDDFYDWDDLADNSIENWYRIGNTNGGADGDEHKILGFPGSASIGLWRSGTLIDIIGAGTSSAPTDAATVTNTTSHTLGNGRIINKPNDKPGFFCEDGMAPADKDYPEGYTTYLSTNRCLLIRKNTVHSGDSAVKYNKTDFTLLCTEWLGIPIGNDGTAEERDCQSGSNFGYVGDYNYNEYYAKYDTIMSGVDLSDQRQSDGTYKIDIHQLDTMSCTNLKIIVTDNNTGNTVTGTWKVPIFVTDDGGTSSDGNVKTNDVVFTKEGDDCATCDVVVLRNANLEVVTGGKNQVRNIEVYAGATLNVPSGKEYLVNQLIMRSKDDVVSKALVKGTLTPTVKNVYLDKRIKTGRWYWISLPYRCRIADVTWRNGELANYGTDWLLKTYDGNNRANGIQTGNWIQYTGEYMEPGVGYILNFNSDILESGNQYAELRFPMAMDGASINVPASVNVPVIAYGANNSRTKDGEPVRPNHLGWNMIGNPYMNTYNKGNMPESLPTGQLVKDPETDDLLWKRNTDGVRYVVVPQNGGHSGYSQVAVGTQELDPFMAYFVQVNGTSDNQALQIAFSSSNVKTSMIRRVPAEYEEDDTHPVWVGFTLSNAEGEKDETALLVSDNFTDDYDMMNDLIKWRGTYYKYAKYNTAPVLATRNNEGEMAFNALSDASAAAGVPVNYFAAAAGTYTFSMSNLYSLEEVEEAWLYDSEENRWTNLLLEDYSFYTAKGDNTTRFTLTAKVARRIVETPTDADNINAEISLRTIDHTLLLSGVPQGSSIYVYDMSGKMVAGEITAVANMRLAVPADGVYNVRIVSPEGNQTLRAIVR